MKDERKIKAELFVNQNLGKYFASFFFNKVMLLFAGNSEKIILTLKLKKKVSII